MSLKDILPPRSSWPVVAAGLAATGILFGPAQSEAAIASKLNPNAIVAPITKDSHPSRLRLNRIQSADTEKQRPAYLMKFDPPKKSYLPDGITFPFSSPNLTKTPHGRFADTSSAQYRIGDQRFAHDDQEQYEILVRNITFEFHSPTDSQPFNDGQAEILTQELLLALNTNRAIRDSKSPDGAHLQNFRRRNLAVYRAAPDTLPEIHRSAAIRIDERAFGDAIILGDGYFAAPQDDRAGTLAYLMAINTSSLTDVTKLTPNTEDLPINLDVFRLGLAYYVANQASGGGKIAGEAEYDLANQPGLRNQRFDTNTDQYLKLAGTFWKRAEDKHPGTINTVEWAVTRAVEAERARRAAANPDTSSSFGTVDIPVTVIYNAFRDAWENSGESADQFLEEQHILGIQ